MSWNGQIVVDMDSHIVERADRFYGDHIDPAHRGPYQQLCDAIAAQAKAGHTYSLFGSRTSVIEPLETGRPLGVRDTLGLTRRSAMEGGRQAFPPGRVDALPPIRREASWDVKIRLEDMASDWPHGDTAWPESVQQITDRPGLSEGAKRKMLGDNALRLCPRLRG